MSVSRQAVILYVATNGLVDEVPLDQVHQFVLAFAEEMEREHAELSGPAIETIRAVLDTDKKRVSAKWQA